jgi:hypothetical protein
MVKEKNIVELNRRAILTYSMLLPSVGGGYIKPPFYMCNFPALNTI